MYKGFRKNTIPEWLRDLLAVLLIFALIVGTSEFMIMRALSRYGLPYTFGKSFVEESIRLFTVR